MVLSQQQRLNATMGLESVANGGLDKSTAVDGAFPLGTPPIVQPELPFNPFQNNSHALSPVLSFLKAIIVAPVFLIRVLLLLTCFVLGYTSTKLALIGARNILTKPFPPWRRACLWPVRLCARGVLFACGFQWIKVKGKAADREVAPILVSNHVTFVDPVYVFFAHLPMIVTAKENLNIPIAGVIMQALQVIAVDRTSPESRRATSGEIRRRAMCNDWAHVALFPEATTTNGRSLVQFKTGAFSPALPVQPLVVHYPHVHVDPAWVVEGPPILLLLFRLMMQLHNNMEVEYLPVLTPTLQEVREPHVFAARCRMAMGQALNVNVTEHTFGDVALALEAEKLKIPRGMTNVEFGYLERQFRLDLTEAKGFLRRWVAFDTNKVNNVSYSDFLGGLKLPDSPATRSAFQMYDPLGRKFFNFRQFLVIHAFVIKHPLFPAAVEAAFQALNPAADRSLTVERMASALGSFLPGISNEQVASLHRAIGGDSGGQVEIEQFRNFMSKNPEYMVVLLFAEPSLVTLTEGKKLL